MPRTCTLCSHESRRKIDEAIASGTSYRKISKRFSTSPAALSRHKSHASMAIERANEKRELSIGESVLARLEGLFKRLTGLLDAAQKAKNHFACIGYLREARGILTDLCEVSRTMLPNGDQRPLLPQEYIDAICVALGVKGAFRPLIKGDLPESTNGDGAIEEDDVIDLPILP
jgi:hypothetical protein